MSIAHQSDRALRVANCSGFYGDRLSAAREMVEGGPIDVLTGDYLAELTLSILAKDRRKDPSLGWAKTFPHQLRQIAATCLERGIRIVVNAGGLNPAGCADACRQVYDDLGLEAMVAHLEGDDLLPRLEALQEQGERLTHLDQGTDLADDDRPVVSANAYLGGWGIAKALELGADLVICPRVTDASLVVGPAAWWFGWQRDDWDRLASAVVAGHLLECGAQATGGNYSFFSETPQGEPGFPLAEIEADGGFTVSKHPGTGGEVSVGTVTAQLLYEIEGPRYPNPDVVARFDTLRLLDDGPDRVRVEGVRGETAPTETKVCLNLLGGFKNRVTFLLGGLDLDAKVEWLTGELWRRLGGRDGFAYAAVRLHRPDPSTKTYEGSLARLTVAVQDPDPKKVGRRFSAAAVELALASIPGFNLDAPPGRETPFAVYWPTLVSRDVVHQRVMFEGKIYEVEEVPTSQPALSRVAETSTPEPDSTPSESGETPVISSEPCEPMVEAPLGLLCGARSGDKGGNANLGIWVREPEAFPWLASQLTVDRLRDLIPETRDLVVDRYDFPNLCALNFVLRGFLGEGVAASLATDPQAKGLGEFLRSQVVEIPVALLRG